MENYVAVDTDRINAMPAKIRDDILWLTAEYRRLDLENQQLREEVLKVANILEDYGLKKDDEVIRIANKLRCLLWT